MELRGWYGKTQWTPGKSAFHGRTGGKHDGLDLYSPVGKNVYACFEGNLTYREDPGGYGHRTFLEGEYRGKTYYLMVMQVGKLLKWLICISKLDLLKVLNLLLILLQRLKN